MFVKGSETRVQGPDELKIIKITRPITSITKVNGELQAVLGRVLPVS